MNQLPARSGGITADKKEGASTMCDYSLHAVTSRPAKAGDKLITTSFKVTTTRGFSSIDQPEVAVCLLAGTEVAFDEPVKYDSAIPFWTKQVAHTTARFRQLAVQHRHHDALEFPDGRTVLVTRLCEGQRASVLQLPATSRLEHRAKEQNAGSFSRSSEVIEAEVSGAERR
jgi:hypothetical protein